ncbi:MAG: hypothetical protein K5872_22265 [Rhizobiaceae bacterium]|nr:hypothetical protein [Rhizobiaceae bacterium]MCV0408946.1 hypothetical protein [Rhizobiaceae bacterium]
MTKTATTKVAVKIKGGGTVPIHVDGQMRRIRRGRRIVLTQAEYAEVQRARIEHTKEK